MKFFGELMDRKKIVETTLKRIEPGSEPLLNETPPTLVLCPPRQNMRVDFRTQLAPTHVGCVLCGGRTDRIQGVWAMWESRVNREAPMVGLLAGYIGN